MSFPRNVSLVDRDCKNKPYGDHDRLLDVVDALSWLWTPRLPSRHKRVHAASRNCKNMHELWPRAPASVWTDSWTRRISFALVDRDCKNKPYSGINSALARCPLLADRVRGAFDVAKAGPEVVNGDCENNLYGMH